ncbi:hypothetical protein [Streptomyces sp. CRN 30]|uniref:hypothetical protein n=1 Tax=Streptomyces sp. CRN 30 TaxID=3075613 RepID=UPI002A830D0E|nr:hypothetical protein [Streptomyces sp. CRN 30]
MPARRNIPLRGPAALVLTALLATSCAGQDDKPASPSASSPSAVPHGYVEGAKEAAEQQSRLLLGDPGTGDTRVLDLITGEVHEVPAVEDATALTTDGRFGYFHTPGGTQVLDGGAWMVDHGDHVHYYSAEIREVGQFPGGPGTHVRSDAAVTAVTGEDGRTELYERTELDKGEVGSPRTLPGTHEGAVVPYEEHLLALTDDGGRTKVVVYDREGERVASPDAECAQPQGDAVTRRGVVLGCADGALLVRASDGGFTAEKIPYGEDVPADERATDFRYRSGSDTLTAPAGDRAVWVLDVGERAWTRVETEGPVVAANTAGEGSPLLVLQSDGALHGYDIATGKQTAETESLLKDADAAGGPVIEVDRSRAYLNDPEGKRVYEIDYNDDLRIARTFDLDVEPALMVETGR